MSLRHQAVRSIALAALSVGCGGTDGRDDVGASQGGILGGAVDDETTGVVGLMVGFVEQNAVGTCTGALIAPNLVLTARHCVSLTDSTSPDVTCGVTRFLPPVSGNRVLATSETTRPSQPLDARFVRGMAVRYPAGSDDVCGDDIAAVILERAMPGTAIPIVPRIDRPAQRPEPFSAVGYGLIAPDAGAPDSVRMRVDGSTVECLGAECGVLDLVLPSEWWSVDAPVCSGDSGGPALDAQGRTFGVVSRGPDTCIGAIYSDVATWKDFVISTALDAAAIGGYEAPFWVNGSSQVVVPPAADSGPQSCTGACNEPPARRARDSGGCGVAGPGSEKPGVFSLLLPVALTAGLRRRRRSLRLTPR